MSDDAQVALADSPLRLAWSMTWREETPCRTSARRDAWYSERSGIEKQLDESHALEGCSRCWARVMCAAWAFEMEEWWIWGGFTARDRKRLRDEAPELIGDIVMIVKGLVHLANRRGTLSPGVETEVDDEFGAMLVRRGYATAVTPDVIADVAQEVLAEADAIVTSPSTRRGRGSAFAPRERETEDAAIGFGAPDPIALDNEPEDDLG